jgi:hypothetical protein
MALVVDFLKAPADVLFRKLCVQLLEQILSWDFTETESVSRSFGTGGSVLNKGEGFLSLEVPATWRESIIRRDLIQICFLVTNEFANFRRITLLKKLMGLDIMFYSA